MDTAFEPNELKTTIQEDDSDINYFRSGTENYRSLFLTIPRRHEIVVVGAIALVPGELPLKPAEYEFLIEVARGIYDAGDVHTVYFGPPTENPT